MIPVLLLAGWLIQQTPDPPPPPPQRLITLSPEQLERMIRDIEREQEAARRAEQAIKDQRYLDIALWVYAGTAGADWMVESICYQVPCQEGPTQTGLFLHDVNDGAAIPIGLAIDAAVLALAKYVIGPDHPKMAQGILHALSAARITLTIRHVNYLRTHAIVPPR
jgi:hypothetical protein